MTSVALGKFEAWSLLAHTKFTAMAKIIAFIAQDLTKVRLAGLPGIWTLLPMSLIAQIQILLK